MNFQNILLTGMVALLLSGCEQKPAQQALVLEGKTMGTVWRVSLAGVDAQRKAALQQAIQQQLDRDDGELSTWKKDSVLSRFNQYQGQDPQPVSADMADIVTRALRIGQLTGGAMDITVGPLVNLWGFGPEPVSEVPGPEAIAAARERLGMAEDVYINRVADRGNTSAGSIPTLIDELSRSGRLKKGMKIGLVAFGGGLTSAGAILEWTKE